MTNLYHYCSFDSFLAIITNNELMFSDITKTNDSQEIKLLWNEYASHINEDSNNPLSPKMLQSEIKKQMSKTVFLVLSFSTLYDSLLLWRGYADHGVCIGFNKDKLEKWASHIMPVQNGVAMLNDSESSLVKPTPIEYYSEKTVHEMIKQNCKGIDFITENFGEIFYKAQFVKSDFWKDEDEWRISIPLICDDCTNNAADINAGDDTIIKTQKLRLSVDTNSLFSARIRCFVQFEPNMIDSITLAPNCSASVEDVKKVLRIYGFKHLLDKVAVSNGSLR